MPNAIARLSALVDATQQRAKEKRAERISKNTASSWRKAWDGAMREHYPECRITYTERDAANLKRAISNRGLAKDDLIPFFQWTVKNWPELRRSTFSSNPKKPFGPEFPDMTFLIMKIAQVHGKYTQGKAEVAAALPLAQRAAPRAAAPVHDAPQALPARPLPKPKPLHLRQSAAASAAPSASSADAEAVRKKLNLPKWD